MLEADPVWTVRSQVGLAKPGSAEPADAVKAGGCTYPPVKTTEDGGPTIPLPAAVDRCTLQRSREYICESTPANAG